MSKQSVNKTIFFDGQKSILLEQYPDEAWTFFSGAPETTEGTHYKFIPTLYRAVQLRALAVSAMPFRLMRGEQEFDGSANWENKIGFMPNPFILLQLIEAALTMTGRAYLFRERNQAATKLMRYILPTSVTPQIDPIKGLTGFKRPVNSIMRDFTLEDIVYFWLPDPYVELGPPVNFPARAAGAAGNVLLNVDEFAAGFFKRGAIRAMLLTVEGMAIEAERQKLKEWWKNVVGGVKNAFGASIINAAQVKPVVIGEGLKELENQTLTREMREDIAVAVGIPMSILFANAANYATSQQDDLNFLQKTVVPECEFIASVLNEQVFKPLKMHLEFLPETLDAFQEDETARAQSLNFLVGALNDPMAEIAMSILGYELDDETLAKLQMIWNERKERAARLAEAEANKPVLPQPVQEPEQPEQNQMQEDIAKWQRKAVKRLQKGQPAACDFESEFIPIDRAASILARLGEAKTADEVRAAFGGNGKGAPDAIAVLASELKRANDLLEATIEPTASAS